MLKGKFRLVGRVLAILIVCGLLSPVKVASAIDSDVFQRLDTPFYDPNSVVAVCNGNAPASSGSISNRDYAGNMIISQGELKLEAANVTTYQQASSQTGVPWQALAALHYREHGFSIDEPRTPGALGVYQITDTPENRKNLTMSAYPSAGITLTESQFLQQTIDAANFIKGKLSSIGTQTDADTIKKALGAYNGLPDLYAQQAQNFGFSADQAYEGSPYVMNYADPARDPTIAAPGTWQQYGTGPKGSIGPAGIYQHGAFLVYASLSGAAIGGSCASSPTCNAGTANATEGLSALRQTVVCLANQELSKWNPETGALKPGTGYLVYSQGRDENWCTDFVSWIYNQANYPLRPGAGWNVPYVPNIQKIGEEGTKFQWHDVAGYTPRPGDLAIHGDRHVNIVVGVSGTQMTLIGGNQGQRDLELSAVTGPNVTDFTDAGDVTGFVSPD